MKLQRALMLSAVVVMLALLLSACRPGTEPQPSLLETMQGTWVATESVPFYGATLTNTLSLTVTESDIALEVSVSDQTRERNTLALSGSVSLDGSAATFTYSGGRQASDNGDGTFDLTTPVELTAEELAAIMAELGGVRTVSVSGTTLTVDQATATELVFVKQ